MLSESNVILKGTRAGLLSLMPRSNKLAPHLGYSKLPAWPPPSRPTPIPRHETPVEGRFAGTIGATSAWITRSPSQIP